VKVGDIVRLHKSTRRNGRFAGLTGLIVEQIVDKAVHPHHEVLVHETGELVQLHVAQIGEVISESR